MWDLIGPAFIFFETGRPAFCFRSIILSPRDPTMIPATRHARFPDMIPTIVLLSLIIGLTLPGCSANPSGSGSVPSETGQTGSDLHSKSTEPQTDQPPKPTQTPKQLIDQARLTFKPDKRVELLERALEQDPDNRTALVLLLETSPGKA